MIECAALRRKKGDREEECGGGGGGVGCLVFENKEERGGRESRVGGADRERSRGFRGGGEGEAGWVAGWRRGWLASVERGA